MSERKTEVWWSSAVPVAVAATWCHCWNTGRPAAPVRSPLSCYWLWISQPQHPHHYALGDLRVWYNPRRSISVSLSLKDERTLSFLRSAPPSVPWVGDVLFRGNMHLVMYMNLVISRFHCMYLLSSGHCGRGTWRFLWNSRPTAELLLSKFPCNQC